MTKEEYLEKYRERIAEIIHELDGTYFSVAENNLEDESTSVRKSYLTDAGKILQMLIGDPRVLIADEDQGLPENPYPQKKSHIAQYTAYCEGQNDMSNFRRVL